MCVCETPIYVWGYEFLVNLLIREGEVCMAVSSYKDILVCDYAWNCVLVPQAANIISSSVQPLIMLGVLVCIGCIWLVLLIY